MMIWQRRLCVRETMQIAMNTCIFTVIWGLVLKLRVIYTGLHTDMYS